MLPCHNNYERSCRPALLRAAPAAAASDWAWLTRILNPRKLFPRNFVKGQSAKMLSLENLALYGIGVGSGQDIIVRSIFSSFLVGLIERWLHRLLWKSLSQRIGFEITALETFDTSSAARVPAGCSLHFRIFLKKLSFRNKTLAFIVSQCRVRRGALIAQALTALGLSFI